jgi:hypothetical protein
MTFAPQDPTMQAPSRADAAARALHRIGGTLCRRTSIDVPGLAGLYDAHAVIVVDGARLTGALGSFTGGAWRAGQQAFDKITVLTRHPGMQHPTPLVYAEHVLTVFLHELTHLMAFHSDLVDTTGPEHSFHTDDFARIARRMGLHVEHRPGHRAGLFTPNLTTAGRARHADLLQQLIVLRLGSVRGIGMAGPPGFTGALPDPPPGIFTTATTTSASFLSSNPNPNK